jgi:signal transduction histidine kinase
MGQGPEPIVWWIYLLAGLVTVVFTATVVGVIVITQRRQVEESRRFSQGLVEAQESERARIARELHDDIVQRVALIGGEVSALGRMIPEPAAPVAQRIEGLRDELRELADEVRAIARRAHPSALDHLGLARAVEGLAAEMEISDGLRVSVAVDPGAALDRLPPAAALSLYRVAQEGLRNVVRHAGTDEARVRMGQREGGVFVSIEDRGAGMAPSPKHAAGLGLRGLTERLRAVGGALQVESVAGQGTRLSAWVPEEGRSP